MSTATTPRNNPQSIKDKRCAESTLEYLLMTLVHHYQENHLGPPTQAALDAIGYRLGQSLAERFTHLRPPMLDHLDIIKWICKEFWNELFLKSIDNLRTNHRGTYVLRDTQFRWIQKLSQNLVKKVEKKAPNELTHDYLILPCAIIRGTLHALDVQATVTADSTAFPQCDFTIVVHQRPNESL